MGERRNGMQKPGFEIFHMKRKLQNPREATLACSFNLKLIRNPEVYIPSRKVFLWSAFDFYDFECHFSGGIFLLDLVLPFDLSQYSTTWLNKVATDTYTVQFKRTLTQSKKQILIWKFLRCEFQLSLYLPWVLKPNFGRFSYHNSSYKGVFHHIILLVAQT